MTTGILVEDGIVVPDQAEGNTIYNKGCYGDPLSGGGLELDHKEALYLQSCSRLEVVDDEGNVVSKEDLMRAALKKDQDLAVKYPVFKDMRSRGYIVKDAAKPADHRVFPRGGSPGKTPSKFWLISRAETDKFSIAEIEEACDRIFQLKKTLLVGILDEEGDVTYYEIMTTSMKGEGYDTHTGVFRGIVFGDRCFLGTDGDTLHENGFYGRLSYGELQLTLVESLYLMEKGILEVEHGNSGNNMDAEILLDYADGLQKDFVLRYGIYRDLRDKGMIPKTGFKYGTTYRCYQGVPDKNHADFMVQPVEKDFVCSWYDVSRAVRVAHTVRKELVFARAGLDDSTVSYIKIKRSTP